MWIAYCVRVRKFSRFPLVIFLYHVRLVNGVTGPSAPHALPPGLLKPACFPLPITCLL